MQEYVYCWLGIRARLYTRTAIRIDTVYTFMADEHHKLLVLSLPAWTAGTTLQARVSGSILPHPSF
jgi:hypothetical protein